MVEDENLSYLSLIYLQRLEFTLLAFERIVFFRLFLTFGHNHFQRKDIKEIALKVDIHYLKLEQAIEVLLKKYMLTADGQDSIGVNKSYLAQLDRQESIESRIKN